MSLVHLRIPLGPDVLEASRIDQGEADEEDVLRVGVRMTVRSDESGGVIITVCG